MKLLALLSFLFLSNTVIGQSIGSLKHDTDFQRYQKIHQRIQSNIRNQYYRLPTMNSEMATAKSPEALKNVLRNSGMKNSDSYVDDLTNQNKAVAAFLRTHPELTKLSPVEFQTKMMGSLTDN
jgi:hypothetical protein